MTFRQAKRCWREGNTYKAKKNIMHGIRYRDLAIPFAFAFVLRTFVFLFID